MQRPLKRLIVIGAGFAGINLVKQLRKVPIDIILVDRHNYHCFQPLLYQVASAALSPADIAQPIRRIFRYQKNVTVVLGQVDRVDLAKQEIYGGDAHAHFDYLALAVGATHSYFGHENWMAFAPGLKTVDDATRIRRQVLLAFEEAELEADEESRREKLTFVVVGGGPTGVEMAGALREIAANDIPRDFRSVDTTTSRIILLQGSDRLLPQFHPKLGERAKSDLEGMGVEVRLNSTVTDVLADGVMVSDQKITAANVIWAAGVKAPAILSTLGVDQHHSGRVAVNKDLSIPGHPNIFVLGDAADATDPKTGQPVPGLAPAAMQAGRYVGRLIKDELSNNTPVDQRRPFHYRDKGMLATIGKHRAVADIRGWRFGGYFAWLLWSLVHITFLISFRNKLFVLAGWVYEYLLGSRGARLITGNFKLHIRRLRATEGAGE